MRLELSIYGTTLFTSFILFHSNYILMAFLLKILIGLFLLFLLVGVVRKMCRMEYEAIHQ